MLDFIVRYGTVYIFYSQNAFGSRSLGCDINRRILRRMCDSIIDHIGKRLAEQLLFEDNKQIFFQCHMDLDVF